MVGEPVQQCAGQTFRAEYLGPFVERQVGGHQSGAAWRRPADDPVFGWRQRMLERFDGLAQRAKGYPVYVVDS